MSPRFSLPTSVLLLALALTLNASPTPTPTPTLKRSFFRTRVYTPASTPRPGGAAVGRGTHLGVDHTAQTPTPRPIPTTKAKASPSAPRKSPTMTPTPEKAAKSPTPSATPSPQKEISPAIESSPAATTPSETITPSPTPPPTPTAKPTPGASTSPTPTAPISSPTKIELTLTKFEPAHGSPGERDYRNAHLSYRINVAKRMEYPVINFAVETPSGKIFERVFKLPAGSAFVEPGDNTEHTVALDPAPRDDWADAYAKTDRATFNWSIEGESSGGIDEPLKKAWP